MSDREGMTTGQAVGIGIDIGGTGIKGAVIDLSTGELVSKRAKVATPEGGSPDDIAAAVQEVAAKLGGHDAVAGRDVPTGVCLPAIVRHGVTESAANISKDWLGLDAHALLSEALERDVTVANDADAAGIGEQRYGAARGRSDAILVTTLGTGIGSALIMNGQLFPNTELGHLELDGHTDYERYASSKVREREGLDFPTWASRLTPFYRKLEQLFAPDLFVVSGGVSKQAEDFLPLIDIRTPLVAAALRNNAGIAGAAALAADARSAAA